MLARLRDDILRQQRHIFELEREVGSMSFFRRTDAAWRPVQASE
jgi:hypothetical protein